MALSPGEGFVIEGIGDETDDGFQDIGIETCACGMESEPFLQPS